MDGAGEGSVGAWAIDAGAAILFAAAAAFAGTAGAGAMGAAAGGVTGFAAALLFLRSVKVEPRRHRLPGFTPVDWSEVEALDLGEVAVTGDEEPLLLEDVLEVPEDSRVVQLFATPRLPSPGELKARIDAHLAEREPGAAEVVQLPVDASAALREALADLRRSIG